MSDELIYTAATGTVYYARIHTCVSYLTGQVWNTSTSAFETWDDSNVTDYDIALSDEGNGEYLGNFPDCDAGRYYVSVYKQAGATPATTDKLRGRGEIVWSGTAAASGADVDGYVNYLTAHSGLVTEASYRETNVYEESDSGDSQKLNR